jgi:hypothetical protein
MKKVYFLGTDYLKEGPFDQELVLSSTLPMYNFFNISDDDLHQWKVHMECWRRLYLSPHKGAFIVCGDMTIDPQRTQNEFDRLYTLCDESSLITCFQVYEQEPLVFYKNATTFYGFKSYYISKKCAVRLLMKVLRTSINIPLYYFLYKTRKLWGTRQSSVNFFMPIDSLEVLEDISLDFNDL